MTTDAPTGPTGPTGNAGSPLALSGLDVALGFEVTEVGPDRAVVGCRIGPQHLQPNGVVHGGVYCALVESAGSVGAATWLATRGTVVGVANHTNFLRAVGAGRVVATATPIHRGRSQQLWLVQVESDDGRALARGELRLQNLDVARDS